MRPVILCLLALTNAAHAQSVLFTYDQESAIGHEPDFSACPLSDTIPAERDMQRREFMPGFGGALAWPPAARAQQDERMRQGGALLNAAPNDLEYQDWLGALLEALFAAVPGQHRKRDARIVRDAVYPWVRLCTRRDHFGAPIVAEFKSELCRCDLNSKLPSYNSVADREGVAKSPYSDHLVARCAAYSGVTTAK